MMLRPFINYYGSKWRAAPRYPRPLLDTVIEPFAGAAGYSLRYPERRAILVEKYAVLAEMWRYLIAVKPAEIRSIPLVESVDDLPSWVPAGARALIGFRMNAAVACPGRTLSAGLRRLIAGGRDIYGWGARARDLVASQVEHIRHWRVIEGDYTLAPDIEATWFIDPPYVRAGRYYRHGSAGLDYAAIGRWCAARRGQAIVCENVGAGWLPFAPWIDVKAFGGRPPSAEAVWLSGLAHYLQ